MVFDTLCFLWQKDRRDTTKLEERIVEMSEECDVTAELIRRCIEENAHISTQP